MEHHRRIARIQERSTEYYNRLAELQAKFSKPKLIKPAENLQIQQQHKIIPISNKYSTKRNSRKRQVAVECFPIVRKSEAEKHKIPIQGSIVDRFVKQVKLNAATTTKRRKVIPPVSFLITTKNSTV